MTTKYNAEVLPLKMTSVAPVKCSPLMVIVLPTWALFGTNPTGVSEEPLITGACGVTTKS